MSKLRTKSLRDRIVLSLVILPILQTILFPDIPGLNSDVAQKGIVAGHIVQKGVATLPEETPYTGTLRTYVTTLSFLLFGINRLSLELSFSIFNSLTILLVYLLLKRIFCEKAGVIVVLVISFSPWFVVRNLENFYYFTLVASLYSFAIGTNIAYFVGGIIIGLGCYENQLAAVFPISLTIVYLAYRKTSQINYRSVILALFGLALGLAPRLVYNLTFPTPIYIEPFNKPTWIMQNIFDFVPYFLSIINGTIVYLLHTGVIRLWVFPLNSIVFIASVYILFVNREVKVGRPLLLLFFLLYISVFLVIKYTPIRYFLLSIFVAGIISGLGIYVLSLRYKIIAYTLLLVYIGLNSFYLTYNYFDEFNKTEGRCTLFRLGTLVAASHHFVRSDTLYEMLDKDIHVIVTPEPFILRNLIFYDLNNGHFKTITDAITGEHDSFYFIDYAKSKLGIKIISSRFPSYSITMPYPELKNFSVYRFERRIPG